MRLLLLCLLIFLTGCYKPPNTVADTIAAARPFVYEINVGDSVCSGFAIGGGLVVTAAHCMGDEGPEKLDRKIYIMDNLKQAHIGNLIIFNTFEDVAIIAADIPDSGLLLWDTKTDGPYIPGSQILTMGFPGYYWARFTFEVGYLIEERSMLSKRVYLFSKSISFPGESGGPVLDIASGKVIGIADAMIEKVLYEQDFHQHNTISAIVPSTKIIKLLSILANPAPAFTVAEKDAKLIP